MGKAISMLAVLLAAMSATPSAIAGPYGDDLGKCLVRSTSAEDKRLLVRWIYFAMSLNPEVSGLTIVPAAERERVDRGTARVLDRLLADACPQEARDAMRYEGQGAVGNAFTMLGEVATQEMAADPAVAKGIATFAQYLDTERIAKALAPQADGPGKSAP